MNMRSKHYSANARVRNEGRAAAALLRYVKKVNPNTFSIFAMHTKRGSIAFGMLQVYKDGNELEAPPAVHFWTVPSLVVQG